MKKIGIMTTGGDCSGLNTVIRCVLNGAFVRGWDVYGILDGTDGLSGKTPNVIHFDNDTLPIENVHLAGSFLRNGHPGQRLNYESAVKDKILDNFNKQLKKSLKKLDLDAIILIGGNGSFSLAWHTRSIYSDVQLICIPKTIDMDIPLTERTVGFETAVQQLTTYCDQLLLTAHSHHRWFIVQAMGRECGQLTLNAGIAVGAKAILIPEIKFDVEALVNHIKKSETDYGIIMVSEGVSLRGHSGRPAEIISRKLSAAGIVNRTAFPEHIQRAGDTVASDRIIASKMAQCALNAIENNETYVMTSYENNVCKTVSLSDVVSSGELSIDPNIPGVQISNAYVDLNDTLLSVALDMGIYIGELKY